MDLATGAIEKRISPATKKEIRAVESDPKNVVLAAFIAEQTASGKRANESPKRDPETTVPMTLSELETRLQMKLILIISRRIRTIIVDDWPAGLPTMSNARSVSALPLTSASPKDDAEAC